MLSWIKTTKNQLQPFVKTRLNKIQKLFDTLLYHHVANSINPEVLISRGYLISELGDSNFSFMV